MKNNFLFFICCFIFCFVSSFSQQTSNMDSSFDLQNYLQIIKTIRKKLPYLSDSETGCIDASGEYVGADKTNKGLNCAGFAKYIADGFYYPLKKKINPKEPFMSVQKLKVRNFDLREDEFISQWEWTRDPYFGLDWTRNIAYQLSVVKGQKIDSKESFDIRDNSIWKYSEDKGYPLEFVEEILQKLAKKNPNCWYLASINGWYGKDPELWQHHHVVCIFPYYDKNGKFHPIVFERNKETSLASIMRRYPGTFMHLIWVSAEGNFFL